MRAKLDESMPNEAAEALREAGWECDTVHDEGLSGADDTRVASVCRDEHRVLFTLDLDFADIRAYPPGGLRRYRRIAPGSAKPRCGVGAAIAGAARAVEQVGPSPVVDR